MTTSSTAPPAAAPTAHSSVVPSEVGWQFVPQYYTFVNKHPNRLHCFYNKNSTFIHGTEGEDGKPCYGQQEIHNKITSIGFEDCKVFIHSVDAQSSANGGIIIQVIGEMSNHGETWRKFVQTFFLAEQPNGYFVLNDIFRFLKEETVEGDDASEIAEATEPVPVVAQPEQTPVQPISAAEPVYEAPREPTPPPVVSEPIPVAAPVDEAPTTDIPEPAVAHSIPTVESQSQLAPIAAPQTNGTHTPEPEHSMALPTEKSPVSTPAQQPSPVTASKPLAPAVPTPVAPVVVQAPPPAAAPVPTPAAPAAPRSWASLAATNQKKWGSVAQESRGISEAPASPAPSSGTQTPAATQPHHPPPRAQHHPGPQPSQGGRHEHPALIAAQNVTTAQCFVKGVLEPITQSALSALLAQRFGPIKDLEIVRSRACAFLEFNSLDSAKRAIIASLSQNQGGEGGVWIEIGGDVGQLRITVETKKERGDRDRPVSRPRGGAPPVNGEARGGGGGNYRGGRGGPGRGRGAPSNK